MKLKLIIGAIVAVILIIIIGNAFGFNVSDRFSNLILVGWMF